MKFILIALGVASALHQSPVSKSEMIPDKLGDKNTSTKEATWDEYKKNRPKLQDCNLNEHLNWYGNHRCRYSWECKGASVCEGQIHDDPGLRGIGWCRGPTACPLLGPLDRPDADGNPPGNVKWDLNQKH